MKPEFHPYTNQQLDAVVAHPRGSYVLYGPDSSDRLAAARWLAKAWHGHSNPDSNCWRCRQIDAGTYLDIVEVVPDGGSIGIAMVLELSQRLSLSRQDTLGHRLAIIDQAQTLTTEAQNALLKLLEEPPLNTVIVLLASHSEPLRDTLKSRLVAISFRLLDSLQVNDPALTELADQFGAATIFERLKLSDKLAELAKSDQDLVLHLIIGSKQAELRANLKVNNWPASRRSITALRAAESCLRFQKANVSPKTAFGRLSLELP